MDNIVTHWGSHCWTYKIDDRGIIELRHAWSLLHHGEISNVSLQMAIPAFDHHGAIQISLDCLCPTAPNAAEHEGKTLEPNRDLPAGPMIRPFALGVNRRFQISLA